MQVNLKLGWVWEIQTELCLVVVRLLINHIYHNVNLNTPKVIKSMVLI